MCDDRRGQVTLLYKGRKLAYKTLDKKNRPGKTIDEKQINFIIDKRVRNSTGKHKPKENHPWRQYKQTANQQAAKNPSAPLTHIPTRPDNASDNGLACLMDMWISGALLHLDIKKGDISKLLER